MSSTASSSNILETGISAPTSRKKSGTKIIVGLLLGLLLLLLLGLLMYWMWPSSPGTPTTPTPTTTQTPTPTPTPTPTQTPTTTTTGIVGSWAAYNAQAVPTNYTYQVSQTGNTLNFTDTNMPSLNSTGTINGNAINAPGMNLTGTLSADGKRIDWSDKSYWLKTA